MMLRSLLRHHRAPVAVRGLAASLGRKPTARIPARGLSTAEGKPKSPSKWRTSLLLFATGLVGGYVYLRREPPELKEAKRLLLLSQEVSQKGDIEQALKYSADCFETMKPRFRRHSRRMILWANEHAKLCQALGRHSAALPYYLEVLKYVPQVSDVLERTQLHMSTLLSIASCYKKSGNLKASERNCKQAIDAYDQFQGQASLSQTPKRDVKKRLNLDVLAISALTGISRARKRLATIVRGSPQLRSNEEELLDQFDDFVALEKMRVERHKQRAHREGSDISTF